ncbi:OLC1v1015340C1 [Oldenlandia corymbosa var. corymbosa]|uniref:OLC1v1015340C1 n=1 Tax=Oldenlandia corymbosa var. corymbosa TaxID=529605 RepID=A0AAV1E5A1_OLDCO|nr:OLC1v1015340C1 [Oldenlandia corymbosa var. corymbosa]
MNSSNKSSNKITEIVRLQQILKKWKKLAIKGHAKNTTTRRSILGSSSSSTVAAGSPPSATPAPSSSSNISKTSKFLKKTLSFSETSSSSTSSDNVRMVVPKGYLAVCVGKEELKRFVIPMEYLGHQAFALLLREAEEEFGFQQEGVLQLPCEVPVFENILKMMDSSPPSSSSSSGRKHKNANDPFGFRFHDYTATTAAAAGGSYCCSTPPPLPPQLPLPECKQPPPQMCR